MKYYALANESHRDTIAYDPVQTEVAHERMRQVFTQDYFKSVRKSNEGHEAQDPIFIVGLPRSGSTLLEQILASHSKVDGTSELPDISMIAQALAKPDQGIIFPTCMEHLAAGSLEALGQQYLDQTRRHREGAPLFTDKMPNNFAYVGFIKAILPNAKIIDARRHPMDSCFGCFKQHFAKGQTFTYDLFELGEFYLEYDRLMKHWDEVLPGEVLRVQYEDVVDDLENQVRRILDFCGFPFEESCVTFHETKRAVRTASSEQVRQPIYRGAMQTWKRYGANLDGLREILTPVLPRADPHSLMMDLPTLIATSVVRGSEKGQSHGGVYLIDFESERVEQKIDWNTSDIDFTGRGWDRGLRGIEFTDEAVWIAASDEVVLLLSEL